MKVQQGIVFFSFLLGILVWIVDAAIDSWFFYKGSFLEMLITDVPAFEIYIRTIWTACFLVFGFIISRFLSKHNQIEEHLRESEEKLRTITSAAKDAIVMMDYKGNISFWNPAAEKIFGYAANEALGRELHAFLGPQKYYDDYKKSFGRFVETGEGVAIGKILELEAVKKDGSMFPVELSLSAIQIKGNWFATGIIRDISERKHTEKELKKHREQLEDLIKERTGKLTLANENLRREIADRKQAELALQKSERFFSTIFNSIRDSFSIVDQSYRIIKANDAYAQMRNKQLPSLIGQKCYQVLQNRNEICEDCVVDKTFKSGDPCVKDKLLSFPNGFETWVEIYTYPIFNEEGAVSYVIEYIRDITVRKRSDGERNRLIEKLEYLSKTDSLTELLNRRALIHRLEAEVDRARRYGSDLSIMLCDIDRFKEINDTYGHSAGDDVLRIVSQTISELLRGSDVAGRYGGDELMVLLPETDINGAVRLAERIRAAVETSIIPLSDKKKIKGSLSLGVTCFYPSCESPDDLIKRVDAALYEAKRSGRNKLHVAKLQK